VPSYLPGPCCPSPDSPAPAGLGELSNLDARELPLPALDDEEGERLGSQLPPVIDAHVHLFPDGFFEAIWRWFEAYGWPIRYKLPSEQVIEFLLSRGVEHIVALHYAHKPGIAGLMNSYMAELCQRHPRVTGLATVLPGEQDATTTLFEAFAQGLQGVKLHCHVQSFSPDDADMEEVYEACIQHNLPLVMHAGREPASPQYPQHPHVLCGSWRVEEVLRSFPRLRLCVPHLGVDEIVAYTELIQKYDNLWLDTTMAVAEYFPIDEPHRPIEVRPERIMYGTDFPNLPYAWDREVRILAEQHEEERLAAVLGETARQFFGIGA
jgi:predicted TIM-barrel fold metal-dependent hydrolase